MPKANLLVQKDQIAVNDSVQVRRSSPTPKGFFLSWVWIQETESGQLPQQSNSPRHILEFKKAESTVYVPVSRTQGAYTALE